MQRYKIADYPSVEVTGADPAALPPAEREILLCQMAYCQAMTDADTTRMAALTAPDLTYTHMSGRQQTRDEYFADVAGGRLRYYTIGIDHPYIQVTGDTARITYTAVLNANAYGARGTFRMGGTHWYEKREGTWLLVNAPQKKAR